MNLEVPHILQKGKKQEIFGGGFIYKENIEKGNPAISKKRDQEKKMLLNLGKCSENLSFR